MNYLISKKLSFRLPPKSSHPAGKRQRKSLTKINNRRTIVVKENTKANVSTQNNLINSFKKNKEIKKENPKFRKVKISLKNDKSKVCDKKDTSLVHERVLKKIRTSHKLFTSENTSKMKMKSQSSGCDDKNINNIYNKTMVIRVKKSNEKECSYDVFKESFGDSPIMINKPKQFDYSYYQNIQGRKTNITLPYVNIFNNSTTFKKGSDILKEQTGQIIGHNLTDSNYYTNDGQDKNIYMENNNSEKLHLYSNNNNLEKPTLLSEEISNKKSKCHFLDSKTKIRKNIFKEKIISEQNINKQFNLTIPCTNCGKIINIEEIDEHSTYCFKNKGQPNDINIIERNLKNIFDYLTNLLKKKKNNNSTQEKIDLITNLKQKVKNILDIKLQCQASIDKLIKINDSIINLLNQYSKSNNIYTLISRIKAVLDNKILYFSNSKENNKGFLRNTVAAPLSIPSIIPEKKSLNEEISDNETTEYFDLELIGKILDEKNENKIDNLDNKVNVAKNKRLFMMEILKIKYKKGITDNDFIDSEMLFNEVMKKNIKMNDWANFILEQINNKEKCLTIKVKKK